MNARLKRILAVGEIRSGIGSPNASAQALGHPSVLLHSCRVRVASLVDDELPEAARGTGRAEVLEVEGEDRSSHPLRDRHHAAVDETEVEVGEARVDLDRAAQKPSGEERHRVLTRGERLEKQTCRAGTDTRAEKLVDLDQHRPGNHQLPPKLGHKGGGEAMRLVAAVRCRDQRAGVGDDPQRAVTSSRR